MRIFIKMLRCSKDNWKLLFLFAIGSLIFMFNFLQTSTKNSVEVASVPINSRSFATNSNEKRDLLEGNNEVQQNGGAGGDLKAETKTDVPRNVPHATEPSYMETEDGAFDGGEVGKNDDTGADEATVTAENKPQSRKSVSITGEPCPIAVQCPADQFSYYVAAGIDSNRPPVICYNNEMILGPTLDKQKGDRGVNLVVIHPKLKTVMDVKTFDLYASVDNCVELAGYLGAMLEFKAKILLASHDDMAFSKCKALDIILNSYGSSLIKNVEFRDSFVLVGEKGLPVKMGIEAHVPAVNHGKGFPPYVANVSGCADHPISMKYVNVPQDKAYTLEQCGVKNCANDEIEVHVATAHKDDKRPLLCLSNQYEFFPGLQGGRGFNFIEYNPISKAIVRRASYDTYQTESTQMEVFLEAVESDNYLFTVVADDGSTNLKPHAKELLKGFGFNADVIQMRTVLYFVGKKGMERTKYYKVSQPNKPTEWPVTINDRFCLPTELMEATMDEISNTERVSFCKAHDSFADFCFGNHKSEPLNAEPKNPKYDVIKEIYNVPILVLAGVNNIALSHGLQALLKQPGLAKDKVFVAYSTMFGDDYGPFIRLFGFNNVTIPPVSKYSDFLTAAFKGFWALNPTATHVIVIDDEIMVKTGFIWYMGHALKAMKADSTIAAASAWNPQGFAGVASNASAVLVTSYFPGQAFMITKEFYADEIKGKEQSCCSQRSIQQWFKGGTSKAYKFIMPEVSRADYFTATAYSAQVQPLSSLAMSMPRSAPTAEYNDVALDIDFVLNYESQVSKSLFDAYYATEHDLTVCRNSKTGGAIKNLIPFIPQDKQTVAIVFSQANENDYSSLEELYRCAGLMYMDGYSPFGSYNGVTILTLEQRRLYLVGTSSSFYKKTVQSLSPYVVHF